MLICSENSVLLVIDVQEKLLPAIHEGESVLGNILWLVQAAKRIGVPVIATEQYPKGLGPTHPDLLREIPREAIGEKSHFSCCQSGCLTALPGSNNRQYIVCGMETHVCVLQTVIDLKSMGKEVFVVAEAVGSRASENKTLALERMRDHNIEIVGKEMVVFEWLKVSGTALFKEISRDFLR